jgi:hypothetical protein
MEHTPVEEPEEDEEWAGLSASLRANIVRNAMRQFPASLWEDGHEIAKGNIAFAKGSVRAVLYPLQSGPSKARSHILQAELIIEGGYDSIPVFEVLQLPPESGRFEMRLLPPRAG